MHCCTPLLLHFESITVGYLHPLQLASHEQTVVVALPMGGSDGQ